MYKVLVSEVIVRGHNEEDKVYREKARRFYDKYGIGPDKVWRVEGRKANQVFIEYEFENRAAFDAASAKLNADTEYQKLQQERAEAGTIVEGSQEFFILTD